jgi:hypothetical protein
MKGLRVLSPMPASYLTGFISHHCSRDQGLEATLTGLFGQIENGCAELLGRRPKDNFALFWDHGEIGPTPTALWEPELRAAINGASFFIPIITPDIMTPRYEFELEVFLARESELRRKDLIFPVLYSSVSAPESEQRASESLHLRIAKARGYAADLRGHSLGSKTVDPLEHVIRTQQLCRKIAEALARNV